MGSSVGRRFLFLSAFLSLFLLPASPASAIILYGGSDGRVTTAPTGAFVNSGWQYEGSWGVGVGTAIAPNYFITARHLGGGAGDVITIDGVQHKAVAAYDDPTGTDLRIWKVEQPFTTYAALYTKSNETTGTPTMTVFGRGGARGNAVVGPNGAQGYYWGASDGQMSWGKNQVTFVTTFPGGAAGEYLGFEFKPGVAGNPSESATLSAGDSGGGLFLQDTDGVWKLAGVNYAVDGNYSLKPDSDYFTAAMYDARDYYVGGPGAGNHMFVGHPSPDGPVWQSAYASRISTRTAWINSIVSVVNVPEPSAFALVSLGAASLAFGPVRRRLIRRFG